MASFNGNYNKESSKNLAGHYLFISFDLVNATEYKIRVPNWTQTFRTFYNEISKHVFESKNFEGIKVWKYIGDEILFYQKVVDPSKLYYILPEIHSLIHTVQQTALNDETHVHDRLLIKATVWDAHLSDNDINEKDNEGTQRIVHNNITFRPSKGNSNDITVNQQDFLGSDIDIGFRISKYSMHNKICVSATLAYLLNKIESSKLFDTSILKKWYVKDKLKIIDIVSLKGVWRGHYYPIIWYHPTWNIDDMFHYDEHLRFEMTSNLFENIKLKKIQSIDSLERIFDDVNLNIDANKIINHIKASKEAQYMPTPNVDKSTEVHVAIVCFNEMLTEVILFKRKSNKKLFSNMWEFGCGQVIYGETFQDTAIKSYKKDFNIDIELLNGTHPVSSYMFEKEKDIYISGVILAAKFTGKELLVEINNDTHTEYKMLDIEDMQLDESEYIQDLKDTIKKAIKIVRQE